MTVSSNGTFGGTGTVNGDVVNNGGQIKPGASIGTLTFNGNYTETETSSHTIEVNAAGETDLLAITGTATLNGLLNMAPLPGHYIEGTSYTFLTAAGGITGTLTLNQTGGIDWDITYPSGTSIVATIAQHGTVLPVPIAFLRGNAKSIAQYMFRQNYTPSNPDYLSVKNSILSLSAGSFPTAVRRLGPTQFGALPLTSLQNDVRIANALIENWQNLALCQHCIQEEESDETPLQKKNNASKKLEHNITMQQPSNISIRSNDYE